MSLGWMKRILDVEADLGIVGVASGPEQGGHSMKRNCESCALPGDQKHWGVESRMWTFIVWDKGSLRGV